MKKTIELWTFYEFSKEVRGAVEYFAEGAHNGHLMKIDLLDFDGCETNDSIWGHNARILKRFFVVEEGIPENGTVYIHYTY